MQDRKFKKIVVKIGTNVITDDNGLLNSSVLKHLVEQIVQLKKNGIEVVVISSGAMGAGRSLIKLKPGISDIIKRQTLASIGQIKLLATYLELFGEKNCLCAQVLVTKEDFRDRMHYINLQNCFCGLLQNNVIPIVNENDVISVDELMFTDNDELAGLISSMVDTDALIILSDVDGVFDRDPKEKDAKMINMVTPDSSVQKYISASKSSFGRGGMRTKVKITEKMGLLGITSFIANGKRKNVLLDIANQKPAGTMFVPSKCKIDSGIKRWIASNAGNEKGVLYVDEGAEKVLKEKIASLLPIGVTRIEGDFRKGDMIKIRNLNDKDIGCGISSYGSKSAKFMLGKKGEKPLVHYNYLFLY